jgi:hypothetical protein
MALWPTSLDVALSAIAVRVVSRSVTILSRPATVAESQEDAGERDSGTDDEHRVAELLKCGKKVGETHRETEQTPDRPDPYESGPVASSRPACALHA